MARTARLEARLSPQTLSVLKRAAEIQGRSVSDFVIAAAHEAAQRTVENARTLRFSLADQERIMELLLNPPKPTPAWKRALKSHAKLIG